MNAPRQAGEGEDWGAVLRLIQDSYAYMEGRIDPPSSMHRLTSAAIAETARTEEVWLIGRPVLACMFLTRKPGALYVGKVAVAASARRQGLARALIETAAERARAQGLPKLALEARVELVDLHATYRAMGFQEAGRHAHAGYGRPTSILFERPVG